LAIEDNRVGEGRHVLADRLRILVVLLEFHPLRLVGKSLEPMYQVDEVLG